MPRISYVNGRYLPHARAEIHIEDRGFMLADAVYEVMPVLAGTLRHAEQHLDRLERSLAALSMAWPVPRRVLPLILAEVVRRNRISEGIVYLQAGRGVAHRTHWFPPASVKPSLVVTAWGGTAPPAWAVDKGVAVVTRADERWARPDIKTVNLLANVMARQSAKEAGAYEAWLVSGAGVTEGTATNAYIVTHDGTLVTHPADHGILGGVTRSNILALAAKAGLKVAERPFSVDEAKGAAEAFISGTTFMVLPVVSIDGVAIGDGKPGPKTRELRALYRELRG